MDKESGKIVITGATGLVGSRLLPRLVQKGFDCIALVRPDRKVAEGTTIVEGDILNPGSLPKALKNVTAIVHLAAVFRSQDTELIWKSNFEGTRNLIAAAKLYAPAARFIMASTSHVYNADNPHPGREDDPTQAEHAYPASKLAAEKELAESGLNYTILRFPFVYGDGDGHLQMLPKHVLAAGWHPAMKISTIHHRDIATAINLALAGAMAGHIVNITDDATMSVYELLQLVDETMESSSVPLENPWHLHVDGSQARSLGFEPTIRSVYQAYEENIL